MSIQKNTEERIKETAQQSIISIKAKADAIRDTKRMLANYGVFDTYEDAALYVQETAGKSDYPLYITEGEMGRYLVKEYILKDADGIPVHNGDIVFFPDDTFCRIQFQYPEETKKSYNNLDCVFFSCQAVESNEEFFPDCFYDKELKKIEANEEEATNFSCKNRLRAWSEEEKIAFLNDLIDKTVNDKNLDYSVSKTMLLQSAVKVLGAIAVIVSGIILSANEAIPVHLLSYVLMFVGTGLNIFCMAPFILCVRDFLSDVRSRKQTNQLALDCREKLEALRQTEIVSQDGFHKLYYQWL